MSFLALVAASFGLSVALGALIGRCISWGEHD